MTAKVLHLPQKSNDPIVKTMELAGMPKPDEVLRMSNGTLVVEINGHDFYLQRDATGYQLRIRGEKNVRVFIARQPGAGDEQYVLEDVAKAVEIIREESRLP